ncbi:glycosyltransferase [Tunturiibacter lichenicola]|uniref:glycosyltransferase n=1 Tax=Tunturiibacter lichenicola TaxID=2051959 RepID=UPI003D9B7849
MSQPAVTLLMPVLNGMPFLPETLESIERQDYKNWEIIVWDNGSTDGTLEELHRWIPSRLPGRVISGEPLKLGPSLARLVEEARSELCARIDADDVMYPERLRMQVAFMQEHPEVGVAGSEVEFIDNEGNVRPHTTPYATQDADLRWLVRWINPISHPSVIFRRSVVMNVGNYRDLKPFEDHDLWFRVGLVAELANLPQVLLKYRQHAKSTMGQANSKYHTYFDSMAELNADDLFTGFSSQEALRLRQKSIHNSDAKVTLGDLSSYRRAATNTALHLQKPKMYFRVTKAYKMFFKEMTRNYLLQSRAINAVVTLRQRMLSKSKT